MAESSKSSRLLSPTVESIGYALTDAVMRLTGCSNVVVVHDPATSMSTVVAASKRTDRRLLGMVVDPKSVVGCACRGDVTPGPAGARSRVGARSDPRRRGQQGTVFRLREESGSVGALVVFAPEDLIDGSIQGYVKALVGEAAHAIGNVNAVQLSKQLGLIDVITGQPNRPGLDKEMRDSAAERCALVSFTVDQLLELNIDLGNAVLKQIATILRSTIRDYDVPARVGGEEFALFLPDTHFDGAVFVANRVRTAMNETEFDLGDCPPMTCAFGIASIPDTVNSIDDLLTAAAEARVGARKSGPSSIATLR